MGARVAALSTNIGSVPILLYGADRASGKRASGLTFQSGGSRLGGRYFVTVARPDHKNLAVGAKRLTQRNLQQILRLLPRAV
jgi:hypothetical protein